MAGSAGRVVGAVAAHLLGPGGGEPPLVKVRAITNYVVLSDSQDDWKTAVEKASGIAKQLVEKYTALGYETQTLRVVTNPFGEFLDCGSLESALAGLSVLKETVEAAAESSGLRIRVAIGEARTAAELKLVPGMIAAFGDLCNICVNIGADSSGLVDARMCELAADVVAELATCTPRGEGNFNFVSALTDPCAAVAVSGAECVPLLQTANFACPERIPYFPAGYLKAGSAASFAIGLEHPDLLLAVLSSLNLRGVPAAERGRAWADAATQCRDAMEAHIAPLVAAAEDVSAMVRYGLFPYNR